MFNEELRNTFEIFSSIHLIASLIVFAFITVLIFFSKNVRKSKHYNKIRVGLGIIMLVQEVILNIWRFTNDSWSAGASLPLHLCGLAVLITPIILFTKSKKLFINTFFIMMIGATLAILTPSIEGGYGYPHFRFWQFFFAHGLILFNFAFILFVMEYHKVVRYHHLLNNFVVLLIIAVVLYPINLLTDGNYLFLMGLPGGGTALDLFGEYPIYILNVLLIGVPIFFHLFYLPFFIKYLVNRQKALR